MRRRKDGLREAFEQWQQARDSEPGASSEDAPGADEASAPEKVEASSSRDRTGPETAEAGAAAQAE